MNNLDRERHHLVFRQIDVALPDAPPGLEGQIARDRLLRELRRARPCCIASLRIPLTRAESRESVTLCRATPCCSGWLARRKRAFPFVPQQVTMRAMPGPVTDQRAHALRDRFHTLFVAPDVPVPVEAIAEDLLGLYVEEDEIECSGLLLPAERRVVVRADEPPARRRFTLAHEVGHWVCQVLEGHAAPLYCREEVGVGEGKALEREANVFAAELLMPEPDVRAAFAGAIADCAERFGVSEEAMHWRLYNLELVEEQP